MHAFGTDPPIPDLGRFDPELGWALQPGSSGTSARTGYEIEYRINSKGLRDDETSYAKPPGRFRIVLLGDSRTFGYGVPIEKHFSRILEGYFHDVDVINLGVSGYGVDQELLLLRSEGLRYEPDLVIAYVAHYGDHRHMHAERWGRPKPRFVLAEDGLRRTGAPVPPPAADGSPSAWLRRHSAAYRQVRGLLQPAPRPPSDDATAAQDPAFERELHELGAAIVAEMHQAASEQRAEFLLVTQIDRLHAEMTARGIRSLNVAPAVENRAFDLPDGLGHLNEAGNGALSWEIARTLAAENLLPAGARR